MMRASASSTPQILAIEGPSSTVQPPLSGRRRQLVCGRLCSPAHSVGLASCIDSQRRSMQKRRMRTCRANASPELCIPGGEAATSRPSRRRRARAHLVLRHGQGERLARVRGAPEGPVPRHGCARGARRRGAMSRQRAQRSECPHELRFSPGTHSSGFWPRADGTADAVYHSSIFKKQNRFKTLIRVYQAPGASFITSFRRPERRWKGSSKAPSPGLRPRSCRRRRRRPCRARAL